MKRDPRAFGRKPRQPSRYELQARRDAFALSLGGAALVGAAILATSPFLAFVLVFSGFLAIGLSIIAASDI